MLVALVPDPLYIFPVKPLSDCLNMKTDPVGYVIYVN